MAAGLDVGETLIDGEVIGVDERQECAAPLPPWVLRNRVIVGSEQIALLRIVPPDDAGTKNRPWLLHLAAAEVPRLDNNFATREVLALLERSDPVDGADEQR